MVSKKNIALYAMVIGIVAVAAYLYFDHKHKEHVMVKAENNEDTTLKHSILETYANIAYENYKDSQKTAEVLARVLKEFTEAPSAKTLAKAKLAYRKAREAYQQTEPFRFGNPIVDAFEGKVNAWPLDEGLIDYVDASYGKVSDENPFYTANIIANTKIDIAGRKIDTTVINKALLRKFHEIEDMEVNVATGYHAIEFLLWGQDLHGTKYGSGNRPFTDYMKGEKCTGGNCERRTQYLLVAADLLVEDLQGIVKDWATDGRARKDLQKTGVAAIITGLGSLAYGELAGERTQLALMLSDPEEEHECFSDLTHMAHFYNVKGMQNVFFGIYKSQYGHDISGPSLYTLIARKDKPLADQISRDVQNMMDAATTLYDAGENGQPFDTLIDKDNAKGRAIVKNFVTGLVTFANALRKALNTLDLKKVEFEGSDSLDTPTVNGS